MESMGSLELQAALGIAEAKVQELRTQLQESESRADSLSRQVEDLEREKDQWVYTDSRALEDRALEAEAALKRWRDEFDGLSVEQLEARREGTNAADPLVRIQVLQRQLEEKDKELGSRADRIIDLENSEKRLLDQVRTLGGKVVDLERAEDQRAEEVQGLKDRLQRTTHQVDAVTAARGRALSATERLNVKRRSAFHLVRALEERVKGREAVPLVYSDVEDVLGMVLDELSDAMDD